MNIKTNQLLTAAIAVILSACGGGQEESHYQRTVKTIQPAAASNTYDRHFSGMVSESNEISLGFKTAGQIDHIYVKEGDYVKKGTLLASLDAEDYEVGASGLRAQAEQLQSELERCRKLFEQKSMSLNDYEKIKAGYAQLEAQLKGVENKIAYTKLYAPVGGHVKAVNFSKAEMVDAGTPVFTLMDDSAMEIVIDIPANLYHSMDRISELRATVPNSNDEIPLQILSVIPKADGNQLFRMKLSPAAKYADKLTSGMNVDVEITLKDSEASDGKTLIPVHSIVRNNDETFVWVVGTDSLLQKRDVILGDVDSEGMVKVVDGLSGDENVVTSGVGKLREGEKVRILQQPSKTNVGGLL